MISMKRERENTELNGKIHDPHVLKRIKMEKVPEIKEEEMAEQQGQENNLSKDEKTKLMNELVTFENLLKKFTCNICGKEMTRSIKIICGDADCKMNLCLECLGNGREKEGHLCTHPYLILDRLNMKLYAHDWTAYEELLLLQGIEKYGMDNWDGISDHVATKTPHHCRAHYYSFYYTGSKPHQRYPDNSSLLCTRANDGNMSYNYTLEEITRKNEQTKLNYESQEEDLVKKDEKKKGFYSK
jgi:hypothetical protein